jgi:hypothetical protein
MEIAALLELLKRFAWPAVCALLFGALYVDHNSLTSCKQARALDAARVAQTTATALANDLAHARAVEQHDAQVAKETDDNVQTSLGSARRAVAAYARLRPAPAPVASGGGTPDLPSAAQSPGGADAARNQAVVSVDDLNTCGTNTIVAQGLQDWWKKVSQPRTDHEGF